MPILSLIDSNKSGEQLTVSAGAKRIFQAVYWQKNKNAGDEDTPRLRVSDLVSKMAFFYEKIRNSVDYREESLLRKEAISRILKRLLVIEGVLSVKRESDPEKTAQSLLEELIRAGYLPNNKLPETKIGEVAVIIHKFLVLRDSAQDRVGGAGSFFVSDNVESTHAKHKDLQDRSDLNSWLISLMAAEIEENLSANEATDAVVSVMYDILSKAIKLPPELPFDRDLSIQIYLGIYRNYLKLNDAAILSFVLFKYFNEDWVQPTVETVERVANQLDNLKSAIDHQLQHPLNQYLNKIVHQYTVYFTILKDVIDKDPKKAYETLERDASGFIRQIKEAAAKRYQEAKSKLWKSAIRSIIFIFLTKSILVVVLEVPAIKFFDEPVRLLPLIVNIALPALLLFLSVLFLRLPGDDNTAKIAAGIEEILFLEKSRKQPIMLRTSRGRGKIIRYIFNVLYSATFLLSFGAVIWVLHKIHFSWVSTVMFLFFLSFASFFAIRIRRNPRYWVVVEPPENFWTFLWSFVSVPVTSTGKWLSSKFSRLNFLAFILDFIIEAPFKIFVTVAEEWTKYLKERRDSIN